MPRPRARRSSCGSAALSQAPGSPPDPSNNAGCDSLSPKLGSASPVQSRSFITRPALVAVTALVLTAAAVTVPIVISGLYEQIALAGGVAVAIAVRAALLAPRLAGRESARWPEHPRTQEGRPGAD